MPTTTLDKLSAVSPNLAEGFRVLRMAAADAGPLPHETVELILVASLAATRQHDSLRVHLRRLVDAGVGQDAIRHCLVVGLGASSTVTSTCEALDLFEDEISGKTR